MTTKETLQRAKRITRYYGRGFYRASFLFPRAVREATWILYAFVRLPDEMVDSQTDMVVAKEQLDAWSRDWKSVLEGQHSSDVDTILIAAKAVFDQYHIPYQYSVDFLHAMQQDVTKDRYASYAELEHYMYGSSSVIGIMMSYIIGFAEGALPYAKALGEAFQLINFLRDTKDDYVSRGRIYLPQEDMDMFGVTEAHIAEGIVDDKWRRFMSFELERAAALLAEGYRGIPLLSRKGRRAVLASYFIYGNIIQEIKKAHYDTFTKRIVVSPIRKTMLLCKAVCTRNQ